MNSKNTSTWVVHKFGGTSVAGAERYRGVAEILRNEPGAKKAIVVSAMSKVTDALIELVDLAVKRDESYQSKLEALKARHLQTLVELLGEGQRADLFKTVENDFSDIKEVLRGVWLSRNASERTVELVSGYGEIWSAQFLNAYLRSQGVLSTWLDARSVLVVEPGTTTVNVDWKASQPKIDAWVAQNPGDWVVITGFIASTPDGIPTTLKRNGSDYSASIFGALLNAQDVVIWTDVDGVLSADPRLVPEACVLEELSYTEATELAYFGAKVVHPSTMAPAIQKRIPIWIRNTFNPSHKGTKIHEKARGSLPIKGFSTVDQVAMVNVEGTGMIGVPGVAQRLFGALKDVGVSVIMISQASSEHSICFAIPQAQAKIANETVERAFFAELHHGQIQKIDVLDSCSILAAVGDNMVEHPGVAGKFLSALGGAGVNVRAIAQGSSERNISVVIDRAESVKALRAAHAGFYLSNFTLSIGVIGSGGIGSTLLKQLEAESKRLREQSKVELRVRAIADSKRMSLEKKEIDLKGWKDSHAAKASPLDLRAFADHVQEPHLPHAVIVDCTASPEIARKYPDWLRRGIHVVTPNKKANTDTLEFYQELRRAARSKNRHYLYETTVGAGLPVINTLRDLIQTGDRLIRVEGVLSGTMSFLFNSFSEQKPFSEAVAEARAKGYTEPDPRDDLSGMDVARKLVILAREAGLALELSQVQVQSLVPEELRRGSVDDFMKGLPRHDASMLKRLKDAQSQGQVLRYVGVIESETQARVELKAYPQTHAFARIQSGDNIVAFQTSRYNTHLLIVQGPGAGPEVTAAGVFADLLRLSSYLGAHV